MAKLQESIIDADDEIKGRVLHRREVLALFGSAGAALLVACSGGNDSSPTPSTSTGVDEPLATSTASASGAAASSTAIPSCVVVPALTEGPYFVDEKLNRSDIRAEPSTGQNRPGVTLTLAMNVSRIASGACTPLANAIVDVWHCDATGVYSDANDQGFNTKGQKFLRGYQTTDSNGKVSFTTIYPGWYQGRAVHIHFKVRSGSSEFTSQFFFDETMSQQVFAQAPYASKGQGFLRNANDSIYNQSRGMTLLNVTKNGDAYASTFDIALQI